MYLHIEISITRQLKTTAVKASKDSDCAGLMWPQAFDDMVDLREENYGQPLTLVLTGTGVRGLLSLDQKFEMRQHC